MEGFPLVSIISTFKDSKDMLKIVMDSILMQSYPNVEHIVIDSDSKDGSVQLLKDYEGIYSNRQYKLIWKSEPDRCIAVGANKAAKLINGSYLIFLTNPFISATMVSLETLRQ